MKDKIHKAIYTIIYVLAPICLWYELGQVTLKFSGSAVIGFWVGLFLLGIYFSYDDDTKYNEVLEKFKKYEMLKTETDKKILNYVNEKASCMGLDSEQYINKVIEYEKTQNSSNNE